MKPPQWSYSMIRWPASSLLTRDISEATTSMTTQAWKRKVLFFFAGGLAFKTFTFVEMVLFSGCRLASKSPFHKQQCCGYHESYQPDVTSRCLTVLPARRTSNCSTYGKLRPFNAIDVTASRGNSHHAVLHCCWRVIYNVNVRRTETCGWVLRCT